jgi:hypothetical protein
MTPDPYDARNRPPPPLPPLTAPPSHPPPLPGRPDVMKSGASNRYTIPAGQLVEGKFLFLPHTLDLKHLRSVTLTIDGKPFEIPGRIVTAEEKTERFNASRKQ